MIYLFSGDDAKNKILNYESFIKSIPKEYEVFFMSRNDFDKVQIESFYSGASLFSAKSAVVFSGVLEYEETREFILEKMENMGKSDNWFVFLESKLTKAVLDLFKKNRAEINVFELPKEKKEKFDNWLVASAFLAKNKFNTWMFFREAVDKGVIMEELIGVIFWKMKDALLRKDFGKFSKDELEGLISKISYLLPEARKKGLDAEAVFERFLLEAF